MPYPSIRTNMNTGESTLRYCRDGVEHEIPLPKEVSPTLNLEDPYVNREYTFTVDNVFNYNNGMAISTNGVGMWLPKIKKVIYNPPATIVYWSDNTKTIVKCRDIDEFSEEYGLAMAIAKRYFGKRSKFVRTVDDATRQYDYEEMCGEPIAKFEHGDFIGELRYIFGKKAED